MRTEFPEEVTTLLEGQIKGRRRRRSSARASARRRQRLRVFVGGAALLALLVGCVVAIDAAAMKTQKQMVAVADARPGDVGYETASTTELATQMSWGSFSQSWCAMRSSVVASTYCQFAGDKQACQEETKAECGDAEDDVEAGMIGSGSGSY